MVETCERYCSKKRSRSSRKDKKSESSKKDDEKRRNSEERRTSKDSIIDGDSRMALEVCSPVKRAYEGEPSLNGENDKRRKTTDEIDSSVPMDLCKNGEFSHLEEIKLKMSFLYLKPKVSPFCSEFG